MHGEGFTKSRLAWRIPTLILHAKPFQSLTWPNSTSNTNPYLFLLPLFDSPIEILSFIPRFARLDQRNASGHRRD